MKGPPLHQAISEITVNGITVTCACGWKKRHPCDERIVTDGLSSQTLAAARAAALTLFKCHLNEVSETERTTP